MAFDRIDGSVQNRIKELRKTSVKLKFLYIPKVKAVKKLRMRPRNIIDMKKWRDRPQETAKDFIRDNRVLFGNIDADQSLSDGKISSDELGKTRITMDQKIGTTRILGASVTVEVDDHGTDISFRSSLRPDAKMPHGPRITKERAQNIALRHHGNGAVVSRMFTPDLVLIDNESIHPVGNSEFHLVWRIATEGVGKNAPGDWIYYVDAKKRKVLFRRSAIQRNGVGYYSDTRGGFISAPGNNNNYISIDSETSSAWDVDVAHRKPVIHTYHDKPDSRVPPTELLLGREYGTDDDNAWDNQSTPPPFRKDFQGPVVDAHRYARHVLNYFYFNHRLNSWDGKGADVHVHVHNWYYKEKFGDFMPDNAFWHLFRNEIYLGDGGSQGTEPYDFFTSLDIIAHEFTHGILNALNILVRFREYGALNEAIADLFGYLISVRYPDERANNPASQLGRRMMRTAFGRNIADPSCDLNGNVRFDPTNSATVITSVTDCSKPASNGPDSGNYYPDHMKDYFTGQNEAEQELEPSINSTIISHAVYLMMKGSARPHRISNNTVTGIGESPIERMLFYVVSTPGFLEWNSAFNDFRLAMIEACDILYPNNVQYIETVKAGFHAVGIGPDLYIRDKIDDKGEEPRKFTAKSPDIICVRNKATAAQLAEFGEPTKDGLGQTIDSSKDENYIYFRVFNRGDNHTSCSVHLYIAPASSYIHAHDMKSVGVVDIATVPGQVDGDPSMWYPTDPDECVILPKALLAEIGPGPYCLIGVIESEEDPEPEFDEGMSMSDFHNIIQSSNKYAWLNIVENEAVVNQAGSLPTISNSFCISSAAHVSEYRTLDVDLRNIPGQSTVIMQVPTEQVRGLRILSGHGARLVTPIANLARLSEAQQLMQQMGLAYSPDARIPFILYAGDWIRLQCIRLAPGASFNISLGVRLPDGSQGSHEIILQESLEDEITGSLTYRYSLP